jgi:hypothetical protein
MIITELMEVLMCVYMAWVAVIVGIGRVVRRELLIGGSCRLEYGVGANNGAACARRVYTFAS